MARKAVFTGCLPLYLPLPQRVCRSRLALLVWAGLREPVSLHDCALLQEVERALVICGLIRPAVLDNCLVPLGVLVIAVLVA